MIRPILRPATLVAALTVTIAGCAGGETPSDGEAGADGETASPPRYVFVTHGQASDPFWNVVANGARDAAAELGVEVEYQAPTSFDMVAMAERIEAVVASRPDGLVVSIPDADALGSSIRRALEVGIDVVSINSGGGAWRELGLLAHVGQSEREAGRAAGERLAEAGVDRALCVNHEIGNLALDRRCDGLAAGLAAAGGSVEVLAVDLADPEDARQRIAGALASREGIDGVLTLGPTGAAAAMVALSETGRSADVAFATFDLSPGILDALEAGGALFAIDQQPYLQGYLPVVVLDLHRETGTVPGGGEAIRTGPGFVTGAEAARVRDLSERGIR